jgi:PAS domain-containing protein
MPIPRPLARRRRAKQRLHYERAVLQAVLASVDTAVVAWGADGRITHYSRRAAELIGDRRPPNVSLEALVGELRPRTHSGVPMPVADLPPLRALQGEVLRDVDVLVHLDDQDVLLSTLARPVEDDQGRRHGAVVVLKDVTEERKREARLRSGFPGEEA